MAENTKDITGGYICVIIAILFFGSNYLPVKKFDAGDGLFFQWVNTLGIWCTGAVFGFALGFPNLTNHIMEPDGNSGGYKYQMLAAVGGVLWASGNLVTVPVIKAIGLGLGMCIWSASNMFCGWMSGFVGIGVPHERNSLREEGVSGVTMNVFGAIFAICAGLCYSMVRPNVNAEEEDIEEAVNKKYAESDTASTTENAHPDAKAVPSTTNSHMATRLIGVGMAVAAGCFYGFNFNPVFHIIQETFAEAPLFCSRSNTKDGPYPAQCEILTNVFFYVFWHFSGIFLMGTVSFLVYCGIKKNKPVINPSIVLPAFASGVMWAIAQICWFYAIAQLGFAVAFPLITSGPGGVALLWGIFLFKEIGGKRNFMFLGAAFTCVIFAAVLTSVSKKSGDELTAYDQGIVEAAQKACLENMKCCAVHLESARNKEWTDLASAVCS